MDISLQDAAWRSGLPSSVASYDHLFHLVEDSVDDGGEQLLPRFEIIIEQALRDIDTMDDVIYRGVPNPFSLNSASAALMKSMRLSVLRSLVEPRYLNTLD